MLALARPLIVVAVFMTPALARAQVILGIVVEEGSRDPVAGAEVALIASSGSQLSSVLADSAGVFRVVPPTAGAYTLQVRRLGYADYVSDAVAVERGETVEVEIRLGRAVIPLDPLIVTARTRDTGRMAGFNDRMRTQSFGRFFTRSEIERRGGSRTSDLLRSVPGVSVVPVRVRGRSGPERNMVAMRRGTGVCEPAIFIDGVRVRQFPESTVDDLLSPETLEAVEVYTSVAGAPVQFTEPGTCGSVLFWTRQGEPGAKFSWKRLLIGAGALAGLVIILR
jgi:hypothetical protein